MSLPYFPLYPKDFEAKTSHLTMLEDGAYNRLLRLCWMTPGCSLPDDEAWIFRRMRAATDEEREAVRTVLAEFFTRGDGRVSQPRLSEEALLAKDAHQRRVDAGRKGGRKPKSLKTNDTDASNAKAKPKQPEPEPHKEEEEEERARESDDLLSQVMAAVGLNSGAIPSYWLPPAASMHVERWRSQLGLTAEEIVAAARASRQRHPEPPSGPKALDRVMRTLATEKAAAPLIPITTPLETEKPHAARRSATRGEEKQAAYIDAIRRAARS